MNDMVFYIEDLLMAEVKIRTAARAAFARLGDVNH